MSFPTLFEKGIYKITSNLSIKTSSPELDSDAELLVIHKTLDETDQLLLNNILKATKKEEKRIHRWVLSENDDVVFSHHLAPLKPIKILVFGYKPADLGLQINPLINTSFTIQNQNMLFSIPLNELNDQSKKRAFWTALQQFA